MIAVFFKNRKAAAEDHGIMAQSQSALQERMARMLRNEAKLAWMPPPAHFEMPAAVKKPVSIRKAIVPVH